MDLGVEEAVEDVGVVEVVETVGIAVEPPVAALSLPTNPTKAAKVVIRAPSIPICLLVSGGGARCISAGGSRHFSVRNR